MTNEPEQLSDDEMIRAIGKTLYNFREAFFDTPEDQEQVKKEIAIRFIRMIRTNTRVEVTELQLKKGVDAWDHDDAYTSLSKALANSVRAMGITVKETGA